MNRNVRLAAAAAALLLLGSATIFAGSEVKVTRERVPKAVLESFGNSHPGASVMGYEIKKQGQEVLYEIAFKEGAATREAIYQADGTLLGTDEDIAGEDLPAAVTKAVSATFPDAKIVDAERLTRRETVLYQVEIKIRGGGREVTFDAVGNIVKESGPKD